MGYYVTTALGRQVPVENEGTVLEDLVLKILYDYSRSPFNPNNEPISPARLSKASRLSEQDAMDVAESLVVDGLVEKSGPGYRISGNGVVLVMNLSREAAG